MKFARLGGPFILIKFEDKAEAKKVLLRGFHCYKELLHIKSGTQKWGVFEIVSELRKLG